MVYTNNVPQGNQTIAFTTDLIRNNFGFLNTGLAVDHNFVAGGTGSNMYHLQTSMPNRADPGSLPAGTNGIFYVSGGNARFYNGSVFKLTESSQAAIGYQWIGAVLLQWGIQTVSASDSNTITFPMPFTSLYNLQLTVNRTTGNSVAANFTAQSATQFTYRISSEPCSKMYWMAIGS